MAQYRFVGPIPTQWFEPERLAIGWDFHNAATLFAQEELSRLITVLGRHEPGGISLLPGPADIDPPNVQEVWWERNDLHTPILLHNLLRGELRAFGDPAKSGTWPEWIAARTWYYLRPGAGGQGCFEGGGNTYWSVRVIPAGMVQDEFNDAERLGAVEPPPPETGGNKPKGGRPLQPAIYSFVRELLTIAKHPDGFESVPGLREHMLKWAEDWASQNQAEAPSDNTVKGWLDKFGLRKPS